MKLHLKSNIAEGSPEELIKYQELLEEKEKKEEELLKSGHMHEVEEDSPMGYAFWYIDGGGLNHLNVLKTSLEGYFEDSKGRRYNYQDVHGLIKPIDREYVSEKFEEDKHSGKLLKYYPTVDLFVGEYQSNS